MDSSHHIRKAKKEVKRVSGPNTLWARCLKRPIDVAMAFVALGAASPLILVIACLVKCSDMGPIFYRGVRSGLHGEPFRLYKFRTMAPNAENVGGPSTGLNDPRLTQIGRRLRKYKLDEIPQLLNILSGDMSFVGPRPQVEKYTRLYSGDEKVILEVRPGLTDYASIRFINLDQILGDIDVDAKYLNEIEPEKNKLRVRYAKEISFATDAKIFFHTLRSLLTIRSTWNTDN